MSAWSLGEPLPPLEEIQNKAAGLVLIGFRGTDLEQNPTFNTLLKRYPFAGVILYEKDIDSQNFPIRNIENPEQLKKLISQLQMALPPQALIAIDQEGGSVQRLNAQNGWKNYPSHQTLGESNNLGWSYQVGLEIATELTRLGINLNFAPVVDVNITTQNPIIAQQKRSFSQDPLMVAHMATQFLQAHHSQKVLTCLKHFPGHGSSLGDTHQEFVDITNTYQQDKELLPYYQLKDKAPMVMMAHVYNQKMDPLWPASLSSKTIKILREDIGFEGIIISDDLQMNGVYRMNHPIEDHPIRLKEIVIQALNAGNDLLLFSNNMNYHPLMGEKVVTAISEAVLDGKIKWSTLLKAHQRIQKIKQQYL